MRALPCMLCSRYPVILTVDHIMHILHSQDVHRVYGLRSLRRSFHRADNDILRARHARTRSAGVPSKYTPPGAKIAIGGVYFCLRGFS